MGDISKLSTDPAHRPLGKSGSSIFGPCGLAKQRRRRRSFWCSRRSWGRFAGSRSSTSEDSFLRLCLQAALSYVESRLKRIGVRTTADSFHPRSRWSSARYPCTTQFSQYFCRSGISPPSAWCPLRHGEACTATATPYRFRAGDSEVLFPTIPPVCPITVRQNTRTRPVTLYPSIPSNCSLRNHLPS